MAVYLCRSYRSPRLRFNRAVVSAGKSRKQAHKKIALVFTGRKIRNSSLKKLTALSQARKSRSLPIKPLVLIPKGYINSFAAELFIKPQFVQVVDSFKGGKVSRLKGLSNASKFSLTKKLYRHFSVYQVSVYRTKFKALQLFSSYQLRGVRQDEDYFSIDKSVLGEFGLIAQEDNSIEEILSSLLLLLERELPSGRIKVVSYGHFSVEEKNQWFEVQSLLIKLITVCPSDCLPHPHFFSI
jgi:hypothetical protein